MAAEALEEVIDLETQQEMKAEIREEAKRLRNNARAPEIKGLDIRWKKGQAYSTSRKACHSNGPGPSPETMWTVDGPPTNGGERRMDRDKKAEGCTNIDTSRCEAPR